MIYYDDIILITVGRVATVREKSAAKIRFYSKSGKNVSEFKSLFKVREFYLKVATNYF